jgi:hypothetical protein
MKKFCRIRNWFLTGALFLLIGIANLQSQTQHYNAALLFLQQNQIDSARKEIDIEMLQPGAQSCAPCLFIYGVIYKELYKRDQVADLNSPYRTIAYDALKKSLAIDTTDVGRRQTQDHIRVIALYYYNNVVATLDTAHYETAIKCYNLYREATLLADPTFDIKKKDIEFYLALGSTYMSAYDADKKKNAKYFDLERDAYLQVLKLDPDNYTANYNIGLLFWNKGVDIIYNVDYDDSLTNIFDTEDKSVELFKESLPFATKAYEIEPKREETLIVLSGIYYSLNDFEKSKAYKDMLDNLRH